MSQSVSSIITFKNRNEGQIDKKENQFINHSTDEIHFLPFNIQKKQYTQVQDNFVQYIEESQQDNIDEQKHDEKISISQLEISSITSKQMEEEKQQKQELNSQKMELEKSQSSQKKSGNLLQSSDIGIFQTSLYGRKIVGQRFDLGSSSNQKNSYNQSETPYQMLLFEKQKFGIKDDKQLQLLKSFDRFYAWKHDEKPEYNNRHSKNIVFLNALEAFHSE